MSCKRGTYEYKPTNKVRLMLVNVKVYPPMYVWCCQRLSCMKPGPTNVVRGFQAIRKASFAFFEATRQGEWYD